MEDISAEYGIPIVNKRISVTPIAMLLGAARTPTRGFTQGAGCGGQKGGRQLHGRLTALVHKGFFGRGPPPHPSPSPGAGPNRHGVQSVNIGATKAGLNMDAMQA